MARITRSGNIPDERNACGVPLLVRAAAMGLNRMPATRNRTSGSRRRCQHITIPAMSNGAITQSSIPPISVFWRGFASPERNRKLGLK
jgi:hypothetical protein